MHTGDVGIMDEDGYIRIIAIIDEMALTAVGKIDKKVLRA
jgi:acyl-CoA synthetase (AMP-forming)/AMP-acid ligase II